jgi:hypothetical protein
VQFRGEDVDLAGQLGVGLQLELLSLEIVVRLGLLKSGLAILTDHNEGG